MVHQAASRPLSGRRQWRMKGAHEKRKQTIGSRCSAQFCLVVRPRKSIIWSGKESARGSAIQYHEASTNAARKPSTINAAVPIREKIGFQSQHLVRKINASKKSTSKIRSAACPRTKSQVMACSGMILKTQFGTSGCRAKRASDHPNKPINQRGRSIQQ